MSGSRETRITIWNRRKLISVSSQQMYFLIRGALSDAGLSSGTRTRGLYAAAARRSRGRSDCCTGQRPDLHHLCSQG